MMTTAQDMLGQDGVAAEDTMGGRIVAAREVTGYSTAQLARRLGVKTVTMQNWENDRSEPRSNKLAMLAGLLGVTPGWLLTGVGEAPVEASLTSQADLAALRERLIELRREADRLTQQIDGIISTLG